MKKAFTNDTEMVKIVKENHLFDSEGIFKFRKDMMYSVFDSWEKILRVQSKFGKKLSIAKIKKIVNECDNASKFIEGLYSNYSLHNYYDENMEKTVKILNALERDNTVDDFIIKHQAFSLLEAKYLPAAYFHQYLSNTLKVKNEYPKIYYNLYLAMKETKDSINEMKRCKDEHLAEGVSIDLNRKFIETDSFFNIKSLSRRQIIREIIPFVPRLYRQANLIKNSILSEEAYHQLTSILKMLKLFPLEVIKKLAFKEGLTRSQQMGINNFVAKSKKFFINNFRH